MAAAFIIIERHSIPSEAPNRTSGAPVDWSACPCEIDFRRVDLLLRATRIRVNVEFEHVRGQGHRHTGIRYVHHAANAAFYRRAPENHISLFLGVAEFRQIFDGIEAGPAHCHSGIIVELLAGLVVNADAFEDQKVAIMRINRADLEQGVGQTIHVDAALDNVDVQVDPSCHLDGSAEGDLAVALREVIVAHGKPGAGHIHREVNSRAARDVLYITISSVLARRNGTRGFTSSLLQLPTFQAAKQYALRFGGKGEWRHPVGIGGDKFALTLVPLLQKLMAWRTPDESWMRNCRKANLWNMPRTGKDALAVPNGFSRLGEKVGQKSAAIGSGEDPGISPLISLQWSDIENVDDEYVTRLRSGDFDRSDQMMTGR